ncbi:hypothetical protein Mext_1609 [Methylorubrum extorquens PA1]|nr:hypothetical protein Mext_1609 [Methylorubrum extorquens PA1]
MLHAALHLDPRPVHDSGPRYQPFELIEHVQEVACDSRHVAAGAGRRGGGRRAAERDDRAHRHRVSRKGGRMATRRPGVIHTQAAARGRQRGLPGSIGEFFVETVSRIPGKRSSFSAVTPGVFRNGKIFPPNRAASAMD